MSTIYERDCYRSSEISEFYRACKDIGQPFIARYKRKNARFWTVRWDLTTMTRDRWEPDLADDAKKRIDDWVRQAVHGSDCRSAESFHSDTRGWLSGIGDEYAEQLVDLLFVTCAQPKSFRSIHNHMTFDDTPRPWPNTLRFDWIDQ